MIRTHNKTAVAFLIALTLLQSALQAASSLPTGGNFTAGSGNISASGNVLNINQNSLKGIIDWNTFSIGSSSAVNFNNGSGATLNRVTGLTPSTILGQLQATGSVYILNPQGILIGPSANIHTGGDFLATTLNLSNKDFLSNKPLTFTGPSNATVINLGDLTSTGGSVYLIGHAVSNTGSISAANGTAGLAAGSMVLLTDATNTQHVLVKAPGGDVTNTGFLTAAQVELKSNGGNIYALAGNNGGQINATGTATQDGHIWLIANNGTTSVSGILSASNFNGTGGNIETSGAHVSTNSATIKTGKNGNWLLDPDDLTIDSALAGTIESSLNGGTNVTEQTTAPVSGGNGDILVTSPITWGTGANLTLSAYHDINVAAAISNTGSGNLTLRADNTSIGAGTITGSGLIDWSASTGNVALLYNPSNYATPHDYSSNFGSVNGAWTAPADGSVSSQYTAYMLVNSAINLQNINNNISSTGVYALGKDIDLSSNPNFTPLADTFPYFAGTLDGMGHTISNLKINNPLTTAVGLFSILGGGGIARNLNLTNVSITVGSASKNAGALAGYAQYGSTVVNSSSSGVIHTGTGGYVGGLLGAVQGSSLLNSSSSVTIDGALCSYGCYLGGLLGYQDAAVTHSYATGNVTGAGSNAYVGGLIGYGGGDPTTPITNSYATGNVSITSGYGEIGGLVGDNYSPIINSYATGAVSLNGSAFGDLGGLVGFNGSTITNSHATGSISYSTTESSSFGLGGLVGVNDTGATITNSYATGNVIAVSTNTDGAFGGLVGFNSGAVTGSYATGSVSDPGTIGYSDLGGLVGTSFPGGTISNSFATGAVSGSQSSDQVGGLVGSTSAAISNSHATGSVIATGDVSLVGGLVGKTNSGGTITTSYATGSVTANGSSPSIGGLVGSSQDTITQSYATGAVSASGDDAYVGGLVGYGTAAISTSYAIGSVSGGRYACVGGLIGCQSGTLTDTYARGNVTGGPEAGVGGLVGSASANIATSYSSGQVSGGSGAQIGGLAGTLSSATITSSYFDNTVNPSLLGVASGDSSGVTGLSTSTLQSGTMPTGFDPTIWTAPATVYPYFGWQGPLVTISGTAYNGSTPIPSATVGALSNGALLGTVTTNGSGFYNLSEPSNMIPASGGLLTYLASNGTANTFSDGGGTNNYTGMDLFAGTLKLISASTTLSGLNTALANALGSNTGSNFLFTVPNGQLTLNSGANLSLNPSGASFTLDASVIGSGDIFIQSPGDMTIASGGALTAGAGHKITLVTPGVFTNNEGNDALNVSDGGNWLVYSKDPANDSTGGLTPDFKQYNATYGVTTPAQSGNGLLYTLAPVISVDLTGSASKTYDGTTTATLSGANFTNSGAIQGDTVTLSTPTAGTYDSPNVGTGIGVTASGIAIVSAANGSIPVYGYQLASTSAYANIGAITAAPPPPPAPNPEPNPEPAPIPAPTTLSIAITNTTALTNQIPVFSATYTGAPIDGLDIPSILAGLSYQIVPALHGPGTYQIIATGTAPDGYTFSINTGTFTLVDASPVTLPSLADFTSPLLPNLLPSTFVGGLSTLLPSNASGLFQFRVFSNSGTGLTATPLAQSPFFKSDKTETYVTGAKP